MTYSTAPAALSLWFIQTDAAEKYNTPCLMVAGSGQQPDYSQLAITDHARAGEWRAQVPEMVAKALRMKPPYVPPAEDSTAAPISPQTSSAVEDTNVPGAL